MVAMQPKPRTAEADRHRIAHPRILSVAANERTQGSPERPEGSFRYLVITIVALLLAVYFALQVIGFLAKLVFLVLAVVVAYAAYNAWRGTR